MANSANITAYADDATTQFTFKPVMRAEGVQEYRESNTTKSFLALARKRLSVLVQKNKSERRQIQTVLPVMEVEGSAGATYSGYKAPPKVAHEVVVQTTIIASPRATASDIANALKLHETAIATDTGAAGTAGTYVSLSNQVGEVLVTGVLPA